MTKRPAGLGIFLRWIGRVLGAIFGAMLGYVGGMEEGGTLFVALLFAALGLGAGAFLGPYVAYLVAGALMIPILALAALGLVLRVAALVVADLLTGGARSKADDEPQDE